VEGFKQYRKGFGMRLIFGPSVILSGFYGPSIVQGCVMKDKKNSTPENPVRWLFLCVALFISALFGGCSGGGGAYGPAYVPQCTCCCSNYYTPYSYHSAPQSTAPISAAMLHDTSGPLPNVSANHGSIKGISKKGGGHK